MNNYRAFDQLRVNELTVLKHGWFKSTYEVTDGQFTYGSLRYNDWWGRSAIIETAADSWVIASKGMFKPTLFISQLSKGAVIGEAKPDTWTHKIKLTIYNGFEAVLNTKKIFTTTLTLSNDQYGDILSIKQNIWKFKTPLTITFDPLMQKKIAELPLLILLSIRLVLLRQQRAAAEH